MSLRTFVRNLRYKVKLVLKALEEFDDCEKRRTEEYSKKKRTDIINQCARLINAQNYLEIGVRNPDDNFNKIQVARKTSVDPGLEREVNPVTHALTSDEFYKLWKEQNLQPFDLIFIDGLHLAEQVSRDIISALAMSTDGGIIVLHDCNPPNLHFARENYQAINPAKGSWNGTTYKAAWEYAYIGEYEMKIVDCDMGVGIINKAKHKTPQKNPNPYFEWNKFEELRRENGLLINEKDFEDWMTPRVI